MMCPNCKDDTDSTVVNVSKERLVVYRLRKCKACEHKYTTAEAFVEGLSFHKTDKRRGRKNIYNQQYYASEKGQAAYRRNLERRKERRKAAKQNAGTN